MSVEHATPDLPAVHALLRRSVSAATPDCGAGSSYLSDISHTNIRLTGSMDSRMASTDHVSSHVPPCATLVKVNLDRLCVCCCTQHVLKSVDELGPWLSAAIWIEDIIW